VRQAPTIRCVMRLPASGRANPNGLSRPRRACASGQDRVASPSRRFTLSVCRRCGCLRAPAPEGSSPQPQRDRRAPSMARGLAHSRTARARCGSGRENRRCGLARQRRRSPKFLSSIADTGNVTSWQIATFVSALAGLACAITLWRMHRGAAATNLSCSTCGCPRWTVSKRRGASARNGRLVHALAWSP